MVSGLPDYYAWLEVEEDADDATLRRAWRRLALRWHPDRAGAEATGTFKMLSTAYGVLSDPVARAAYDRKRRAAMPAPEPAPRPASEDAPPRKRAPSVMLQRLSGPLASLIACGVARRIAEDVVEIVLEAAEAESGGIVTISMRVPIECPACTLVEGPCARCGDTGRVDELFSAWLAIPPGVADGAMLAPSALLPGMRPVSFRVRRSPGRAG